MEKIEMQTMKQTINRLNITAESVMVDTNPHMADSHNMDHWKVTLKRRDPRRQFTVYFSQGYAISHEPHADDVLDCLASDAAEYENAQDFEDWASEYGYDTDSRKAERIYHTVGRQTAQLKRFMGDEYEALLWETERL